jgi:hypothetical protein
MNVDEAWRRGYTGKGISVTILDDGLQINHADIAPNYVCASMHTHYITHSPVQDQRASTDLNSFDSDPTPQANRQNA